MESLGKLTEPDKYTIAWWKSQFEQVLKGYRGATHGINRCLAEYADCWDVVQKLQDRCDSLEQERDEANAAIGEMRERLQRMEQRLDRQAEWVQKHVPAEVGE